HREVISGSDTVLTFEPHPLHVVRPEAAPKLLTSLDAKAELIGKLGVDELVVIPFDRGFANQSPDEFIDHVLVERLQAIPRCLRPTGALRREWCRWSRSTARSCRPAISAGWCSRARSSSPSAS